MIIKSASLISRALSIVKGAPKKAPVKTMPKAKVRTTSLPPRNSMGMDAAQVSKARSALKSDRDALAQMRSGNVTAKNRKIDWTEKKAQILLKFAEYEKDTKKTKDKPILGTVGAAGVGGTAGGLSVNKKFTKIRNRNALAGAAIASAIHAGGYQAGKISKERYKKAK